HGPAPLNLVLESAPLGRIASVDTVARDMAHPGSFRPLPRNELGARTAARTTSVRRPWARPDGGPTKARRWPAECPEEQGEREAGLPGYARAPSSRIQAGIVYSWDADLGSSRQEPMASSPPMTEGASQPASKLDVPPVIIACAQADASVVDDAARALTERGHRVELALGADAEPQALTAAV